MLPLSTAYAAFAGIERIRRDACTIAFVFYFSDGTPCTGVSEQSWELAFMDDAGTTVLTKSGSDIVATLDNRLQVILSTEDKTILNRSKYNYALFNVTNARTEVVGTFLWQKGRPSATGILSPADLKIVYNLVTNDVAIGGFIFTGLQGSKGWSPVFSVTPGLDLGGVSSSVLKLVDWSGGAGTKPTLPTAPEIWYVGTGGFTNDVAYAVNIRGAQGIQGAPGSKWRSGTDEPNAGNQDVRADGILDMYLNTTTGEVYRQFGSGNWISTGNIRGVQGNKGWTPILANVLDGVRLVQQVIDWSGGEGTKPTTRQYIGAAGLVDLIANGRDIRGMQGLKGDPGTLTASAFTEALIPLATDKLVLQRADNTLVRFTPDTGLPTTRPTLNFDFANSRTVSPLLTFTRNSIATRINSVGVMETVGANIPRIDFDPLTGECKGLLIEEARTNLLLRSNDFTNTYWVKSVAGTGIVPVTTANYGVSPDGTTNATRLQLDSGISGHSQIAGAFGLVAAGQTTTVSVWLKSLVGNVDLTLFNGDEIQNVTVTTSWKRFSYTRTYLTSATEIRIAKRTTWASGGVADLLIWGAQVEVGSFATSYIPTTTAAVTRQADSLRLQPLSGFLQTEGTLFAQFEKFGSNSSILWELKNNSNQTSDRINAFCGGADKLRYQVVSGGTTSLNSVRSLFIANEIITGVVGWKSGSNTSFANGSLMGSSVTTFTPVQVYTQLNIGGTDNGNYGPPANFTLNGWIRKVSYYPARLSDLTLQTLTV